MKTPVILVQSALVHQCDEAAKAIQCKVQEIHALERFAADARAACFRAGAGDLQIGLLTAGVSPYALQFPTIARETQETGCQAGPTTQSISTQDGTGIEFIDHNLKDCDLHHLSTKIMDGYLKKCGFDLVQAIPSARGPMLSGLWPTASDLFCLLRSGMLQIQKSRPSGMWTVKFSPLGPSGGFISCHAWMTPTL